LTTNHSGFWREPEHFTLLTNTVLREHPSRIRIWSAACATGEEPYTIAMCALSSGAQNCAVIASDISATALRAAREGSYEPSRLTALPPGWRERFFSGGPLGPRTSISQQVKSMVTFNSLNLLQPFHHLGQFDVIFCRNVMIYFEQTTRDELVSRLAAQLAPNGLLFTGHSETLLLIPPGLTYVQAATYRKL
ncbi:MAG: protein-glutamate O-methyltransferase CheR, partial [Acidobacteriota bacterium]|nr:protein-glutamate O-methyltransferase CheR [Acidobacteriota bacterium]